MSNTGSENKGFLQKLKDTAQAMGSIKTIAASLSVIVTAVWFWLWIQWNNTSDFWANVMQLSEQINSEITIEAKPEEIERIVKNRYPRAKYIKCNWDWEDFNCKVELWPKKKPLTVDVEKQSNWRFKVL